MATMSDSRRFLTQIVGHLVIAVWILLGIGIPVAIIYVIAHFVIKYW